MDPANYAMGMRARVGGQLWGRHQRMHVGGGKARVRVPSHRWRRWRTWRATGPFPGASHTWQSTSSTPLSCSSTQLASAQPSRRISIMKYKRRQSAALVREMPKEEDSSRPDADKSRMPCHSIAPLITKVRVTRDA